jgi:hypothetical protein
VEVICSSETSVDIQQTAQSYIPSYNHGCENLKSDTFLRYITATPPTVADSCDQDTAGRNPKDYMQNMNTYTPLVRIDW